MKNGARGLTSGSIWTFARVLTADAALMRTARTAEVDALCLDLGDTSLSTEALESLTAPLRARPNPPRIYFALAAERLDAMETSLVEILRARPDGMALLRCLDGVAVRRWGAALAVAEAELGALDGSTPIIAIVGGAPESLLRLGSFAAAGHRLSALAFDGEALKEALGSKLQGNVEVEDALATARSLTAFAAAAAGVGLADANAPGIGWGWSDPA